MKAPADEAHAVEPALLEAVARRLDREMRHLGAGEVGQDLVQLDRIGRGQVAVHDMVPGATRPIVPRLAALWPAFSQICRRKTVTEVLPLVPVTAATVRG